MYEGYIFIDSVLGLLGIAYAGLIVSYTYGWFSLPGFKTASRGSYEMISVIVPVRNEAKNIINCLDDLLGQKYPGHCYEIIIVDDHSEDGSLQILEKRAAESGAKRLKVIRLNERGVSGKKNAIREGIRMAGGKLIATTDADCRIGHNWLSVINAYYRKSKARMIAGPVSFHQERSWFEKMQSLEFLSLIASGAGSIAIHAPVMCNGANLAYEKAAYEKAENDRKDENFMSGDDIFLMLKIRKIFGKNAVHFLKSREAVVYTEAKKTFRDFISQRIRWVSKSRAYTNLSIIFSSLVVYFFNYAILAAFVLSLWFPGILRTAVIMLGIKLMVDLPILWGITRFTGKTALLWLYPFLEAIYVLYISFIGMIGNFAKFSWKGRKSI